MGRGEALTDRQRARLGELVERARAERNLSQKDFAQMVKVSQSTISNIQSPKKAGGGFLSAIAICDKLDEDYVSVLELPDPKGWQRIASSKSDPPELAACLASVNYPPSVIAALRAKCHEEGANLTESEWRTVAMAFLGAWQLGERAKVDASRHTDFHSAPQLSTVVPKKLSR